MVDDFASKQVAVYMGIYFGGSDAFMPQHRLDGSEVGAAFQQMRRKRMPEGMGADRLPQTDAGRQLLDDVKNHDAGDVLSKFADEDIVLITGPDALVVAVVEIQGYFSDRFLRNGHQALFVAFPFHLDEAVVEI